MRIQHIVIMALLVFGLSITDTTSQSPNYVYVQHAEKASLVTNDKGVNYQLVLTNVDPYVTYFSGSPDNKVGVMPLSEFYKQWNSGMIARFEKDKPNVGFAKVTMHHIVDGKDNTRLFSLSDPRYEAKGDTVTYKATLQDEKDNPKKTIDFQDISLFFDGYCPECNG